jgi:signal peptidase I
VRRHGLTVVLLAILLVLVAVVLWFKPYRVTSGSMAPTAMVGQRVLADHVSDGKWTPKVGQVIVFKAPAGAEEFADRTCAVDRPSGTACVTAIPGATNVSFVKRVVGTAGDRLRVEHGHVIRNGKPVDEGYARSCEDEICNLAEFTVPADSFYVMGDNRGDSSDSRFWGPVPRDQIIGRVFGSYWPLSRLGRL